MLDLAVLAASSDVSTVSHGAVGQSLAHGTYYTNADPSAWHKCDDPWGCYLKTDGNPATTASNPQGHTQWTPVDWQTWQNYNVTSGPYAVESHTVHTTHLAEAHTTSLDGNGEYWDANIMERPDNTSGGDLWNPPDSESCCGIHYGAVAPRTLGVSQEIAVMPTVAEGAAQSAPSKMVKPSPGHFILTAHAMTLGAFSATVDMGKKLIDGELSGPLHQEWMEKFSTNSKANANAITPLGGYILEQNLA